MLKVIDGNEAVAEVSYAYTEVAVIYPITPSSTMAEKVEEMSRRYGTQNMFGNSVKILEMQSEAGVAGAMHGILRTGALTTTYTCSQGLLLMIPTLYKMVGERLPAVFHISSRAITTSGLSIFGDHSDVMAARQTGAILLSSSSVQEAALFAAVAHELSVEASLPVLHFFDGFNTSHEQRKINLPSQKELFQKINHNVIHDFKVSSIRNDNPKAYGASIAPDLYFQQIEASNGNYLNVSKIVNKLLMKYQDLFGISSQAVDYFGVNNAKIVIVSMGSVSACIQQVVNDLNSNVSEEFGCINLHLYRPFPLNDFLSILPKTVECVVVLDRTKEAGSLSEPLLGDVKSACYECVSRPKVIGGRYGLGSKDTTPDMIRAAFMEAYKENPKNNFTLGIDDDVTHLSLQPVGQRDLTSVANTFQVKTWGFGSDGAVSCNKQTAKIIGELTSLDVQGQFWFDSKKSGNVTVSHLRFSNIPILSSYRIYSTNFVSCYNDRYLERHDVLADIQKNGVFLLNTSYSVDKVGNILPDRIKKQLAQKNIRIYIVPANKIARKYDLGPRINMIMQVCFFKLTQLVPFEKAYERLKKYVNQKYKIIGPDLVEDNLKAMRDALDFLKEVPVLESWGYLEEELINNHTSNHIQRMLDMTSRDLGNQVKVSDFVNQGMSDGARPLGTTKYEKRFVCQQIPDWNSEQCLQCNLCATICPHAAIRPFLFKNENSTIETAKSKTCKDLQFRVQVSPYDCTGCQLCYDICPARGKALKMKEVNSEIECEQRHWDYALSHHININHNDNNLKSMRDVQLLQPLLEFSSACAGCGETAYIKLLTQLFGDSMIIANATGCSSIWGCSDFSVPYTTNENGYGPVWATSLLENNAEYGFGMQVGTSVLQDNVAKDVHEISVNIAYSQELRGAAKTWCEAFKEQKHYQAVSQILINALINEKNGNPKLEHLYDLRFLLSKRSQWIIGGDGWAYDIGYGGLDHVISSGRNINILVLDNEGYANTGGQISKATPTASRTKFASIGNEGKKKDLAGLLIQNEGIYVAQIALGANPEQALKAILEAESYDGPSVLIAYSPCVLHGISQNSAVIESQKAVECGYWSLFRFCPETLDREAYFKLDSKSPKWKYYQNYLQGERRYSSLNQIDKDYGQQMLDRSQKESERRFNRYKQLSHYYKGEKKYE